MNKCETFLYKRLRLTLRTLVMTNRSSPHECLTKVSQPPRRFSHLSASTGHQQRTTHCMDLSLRSLPIANQQGLGRQLHLSL